MKKLEALSRLVTLEERKERIETLIIDVHNHYCEGVEIKADIIGHIFNKKYDGGLINVSKAGFKDFLTCELDKIEEESTEIMEGLK